MAEVSGSSVPADNSLIISLHYIYVCIKKKLYPNSREVHGYRIASEGTWTAGLCQTGPTLYRSIYIKCWFSLAEFSSWSPPYRQFLIMNLHRVCV